ncbi:hypothetical protein SAMN05518861_13929 [Mesorhizobium sp. YR577]|nr:hypothetical protein SAMN05518861_13929 [Mesorhizobium sp. YR577]
MLGDDRDSVPASSDKAFIASGSEADWLIKECSKTVDFERTFGRSAAQCPDFRPVGGGGCYRPPSQRPSRQTGRWLTSHHPHPSNTTWAASCVSLCLAAKMDDCPRENVRIGGAWITSVSSLWRYDSANGQLPGIRLTGQPDYVPAGKGTFGASACDPLLSSFTHGRGTARDAVLMSTFTSPADSPWPELLLDTLSDPTRR